MESENSQAGKAEALKETQCRLSPCLSLDGPLCCLGVSLTTSGPLCCLGVSLTTSHRLTPVSQPGPLLLLMGGACGVSCSCLWGGVSLKKPAIPRKRSMPVLRLGNS